MKMAEHGPIISFTDMLWTGPAADSSYSAAIAPNIGGNSSKSPGGTCHSWTGPMRPAGGFEPVNKLMALVRLLQYPTIRFMIAC